MQLPIFFQKVILCLYPFLIFLLLYNKTLEATLHNLLLTQETKELHLLIDHIVKTKIIQKKVLIKRTKKSHLLF